MRRSLSSKIERVGVAVAMKAFEQLGWVFREQPTQDYGIDAHVELVDREVVSGRLLGLQIKSGKSYFSESGPDGWWFRPDLDHVTYWLNHSLPVAVVLYHPEFECCFWQLVNKRTLVRTSSTGWKLLVPKSQVLDERSAAALRESVEIDPLLRLRSLDFRGAIVESAQGFQGREWLFADISHWCERAMKSLLILGDPGVGKSAIAAKLVLDESRVVAHFFCRHDEAVTLLPGRLVHTLAAQVAAAFPAYRARLNDPAVRDLLDNAERDPVTALIHGVFGPLGEIKPPSKTRYLVVDALDEALACAQPLNIVRVLAATLARLPRWLRLIATARNEAGVTERLRELQFHRIDTRTPDSRADLRAFVAVRLAADPAATRYHIDTLCGKSAGNFLYAVQTLQDIGAGHLRLAELEQLPPGLGGRYLVFFERHFPDGAGFASAQRLLDVIVAAAEPLRAGQLAEATGLDPEGELPRLGRYLRPYLKHQTDWGRDPIYALYHKSLSDWLTASERHGAVYTASLRRGHTALAGWLLGHYRRGRTRWPAYMVRHLPTHLHRGARWDDLAAVLCDPNYLEARVESGDVAGLVADLAVANGPNGLPADHPARPLLQRVEGAVRRDLSFIARHPAALFQCLWNSCWWYDSAEAADHYVPPDDGWGPDGPPWHRPTLAPWMQSWREAKERAGPFVWVRSLRPPPVPLGGPLRAICSGHNGAVRAVAFSPDGRVLASGAHDGDVRLWDCDTGQEVACFAAHERGVGALCWSPDGELLASGGLDDIDSDDQWTATVRVWDRDGGVVACLHGHRRSVTDLSWSPDGALLASAADWDTVRLWDAHDHFRQVARLRRTKQGEVSGLHWSPDGKMLACGLSEAGTVCVWDRQGHNLAIIRGSTPDVCVEALSWSPDSRLLASSWPDDRGGRVRLWDGETRRESACLPGEVDMVSWSPDGWLLAITSLPVSFTSGGLVRLWDVSGRELACMSGHDCGVTTLAWSPDSRFLASVGNDGLIWLWDPIDGRPLICLWGHEDRVDTLSWSPDGRLLSSGSYDHTVRVWSLESGRQLASLGGHKADVNVLSWSPDGQILASGSENGTIRLWDADGRERGCLRGHERAVWALCWSPDGQLLASGSADETVRLWDRDGRALVCLGEVKKSRTGYCSADFQLGWSPDGRVLASASNGNAIRLWTREGLEAGYLHGHARNVHALRWSPDGSMLASGSDDQTIRLWDGSGRELRRIRVNGRHVRALSWSPDGRLIAGELSDWVDHTVQVWDTENGAELAVLRMPEKTYVRSLTWTDDGRRLRIVDSAARVTHWPVSDGPGQNIEDQQTDGWLSDNRGGLLVFHSPDRQKPRAWFPVKGDLESADGCTWACRAGAEVYLLRLEGMESTVPRDR